MEELNKNKNKLIEASCISGTSASLANLIGFPELASELQKYHDEVLKFHNHLASDVNNIKTKRTEELIDNLNNLIQGVQPHLARAYEVIHA